MTQRPINAIVYCNKFKFKDPSNQGEAHPLTGRVYEAHYDGVKDQYIIAVPLNKEATRNVAFIFSGDSGNNPVWEYEFTEITSRSAERLDLHSDDMRVIEGFIEKKGKEIDIMDAHEAPAVDVTDSLGSEDDDEEEEEDDDEEPTDEEIKETEAFIKEVMGLSMDSTSRIEKAVNAMNAIIRKDSTMAAVLQNFIIYLASTYEEKYAKSPITTNGLIYSKDHGLGFNIGNAAKYLSRYMTIGFDKSANPKDLDQAIHYCMFELARRAKL